MALRSAPSAASAPVGSARAASGTARMASAARFMLAPRSPSPASESSSVSVGSLACSAAAAATSAGFRAAIQRWPAASGAAWASPCSIAGAATWMSWLTRPPPGQARAPVAASSSASRPSSTRSTDSEQPGMSSADSSVPDQARSTAIPRGQLVIGGAHDHVQLHLRRGAQAVDQQRDARAGRQAHVLDDVIQQGRGQLVGRQHGAALDALLAMDAQAQLDLVVGQREAGFLRTRQRAAAQGHAHRAELRGRLARGGGDLRQRQPRAAAAPAILCTSTVPAMPADVRAACAGAATRRRRRWRSPPGCPRRGPARRPGRSSTGRRCSS